MWFLQLVFSQLHVFRVFSQHKPSVINSESDINCDSDDLYNSIVAG